MTDSLWKTIGAVCSWPRVEADTLGLLDLTGEASELMAADKATLAPLFRTVAESTVQTPTCSLLLLYCTFEPDGRIVGTPHTLETIVLESGAPLVILARPQPLGVSLGEVLRRVPANVVTVLDRKGDAFGRFFHSVVADMKRGIPFPWAWWKLAPPTTTQDATKGPESWSTMYSWTLSFGGPPRRSVDGLSAAVPVLLIAIAISIAAVVVLSSC